VSHERAKTQESHIEEEEEEKQEEQEEEEQEEQEQEGQEEQEQEEQEGQNSTVPSRAMLTVMRSSGNWKSKVTCDCISTACNN
jgi:hypothetical protein